MGTAVTWFQGAQLDDGLWDPESVDDPQATLGVEGLMEQWAGRIFGYVVVEERAGGVVSLELSPWPHLDERGRLSFDSASETMPWSEEDEETATVVPVVAEEGMDLCPRIRFGVDIAPHPIEVGDVYGVAVNEKMWPSVQGRLIDRSMLTDLFLSPLYDVTPEAQEAARIALATSVCPPLELEKDSVVVAALHEAEDSK